MAQVGPERWTPVAVGKAHSLPEYMLSLVLDMPRDIPGVLIAVVSKEQYDHDKKVIAQARRRYAEESGSDAPVVFITGTNGEA